MTGALRAPVAAAFIVLCACTSSGDGSREPGSSATLAPGEAFRDGLLYAAIKAKLAGMDIDSTTRISVAVHAGEVTLSGRVKDDETKARDVKLVRDIRGVKAVNDRLGVGHTGPSAAQAVSDAALVAAVAGSLAAQTGINVTSVKIRATGGTVTLAGSASTAALKSTMLAAAHKTPGVRNVVDRITVK